MVTWAGGAASFRDDYHSGLGWRKELAAFYRNSSSSFCSPGVILQRKPAQVSWQASEAEAEALAAMAPVQHLLQLVTSSPARLPTPCRGQVTARGQGPSQDQHVFVLLLRHCNYSKHALAASGTGRQLLK